MRVTQAACSMMVVRLVQPPQDAWSRDDGFKKTDDAAGAVPCASSLPVTYFTSLLLACLMMSAEWHCCVVFTEGGHAV